MLKKYKTLSIEMKATVWFFACNALQKGIQYLTLPLFSRLLTVEQYGQYTVFISWLSVISIVATLNLSAGMYMTGMTKYEKSRDEYTANMIGLSCTVTAVVGITYMLFYDWIRTFIQLDREYVLIILIYSLFSPSYLFWSAHERFERRYIELTVVTCVGTLMSPIASCLLLWTLGDPVLAICLGYICGHVANGIYCFIRQIKKSYELYCRKKWTEALRFSIPLIPHYFAYVILGQADRVMIDSICGSYQAGLYGLAYQLANAVNLISTALDQAFSPVIYMGIKRFDPAIRKK